MEQQSTATDTVWRRAALACLGAFAGALALVLIAVIVIDPYDSGRFPTFMPAGSPDERQPTIGISRGRDPRFNAILFGSSRSVLVDPRRLSALAGFRFVNMAAEGATPREHMALLHWFARHRSRVDAIVAATDETWCTRDPALPGSTDFPLGLYGDSNLVYLKTALSSSTLTFAKERILYAFGRMPRVDHESFYDNEHKHDWRWPDHPPSWGGTVPSGAPATVSLPALALFDTTLEDVPGSPAILFWMPPYYRDALPPPDTVAGRQLAECKQALKSWTQGRAHAGFLDLAVDTPETADRRNFLGPTHVSNRFMRIIEPQLAAALNQLK